MTYLGKDKNGYRYYQGAQRYIFTQRPTDRDCWVNGKNMKGRMVGWLCSDTAWERTFEASIQLKKD